MNSRLQCSARQALRIARYTQVQRRLLPQALSHCPESYARLFATFNTEWTKSSQNRYDVVRRTQKARERSASEYELGFKLPTPIRFTKLGIKRPVADALSTAFPNVQEPTESQRQFIPAILRGEDVLLHDGTGTGKSFGILLALLSKQRTSPRTSDPRTQRTRITSLVIVPHRELAFQMLEWAKSMLIYVTKSSKKTPVDAATIVQAVVRGADSPMEEQIELLNKCPPHILIGTPQALLEIWQKSPSTLRADTLSTIVVDEVDYLIDIPSRNLRQAGKAAAWKNFRKHPSPTRVLLDGILMGRKPGVNSISEREDTVQQKPRRRSDTQHIQLVMSSATAHSNLRLYVTRRTGWLGSGEGDYVVIRSRPLDEDVTPSGYRKANVLHHALLVSRIGRLSNIDNAVNPQEAPSQNEKPADEAVEDAGSLPSPEELALLAESDPTDLLSPHMLEAVASVFVTDVASLALLVAPTNVPVLRAVQELRVLGVDAREFDWTKATAEAKRRSLDDVESRAAASPMLLVANAASTRGIDIPELTHVFVLGVPDRADVDVFRHIAGRVDRFGRGGKVITFLREQEEAILSKVKKTIRNEPGLMKTFYRRLEITPLQFDLNLLAETE